MTTTEMELASSGDMDPTEQRRLNALHKLAQRFANAEGLVPKEIYKQPDKAFFLMCAGEQFGLSPARSLTDLWIINGRIEPSAQVRIAVVMARGHEVLVEDTSSERCVIAVRRAGGEIWQRLTYTVEDARQAGALDEWVELWCKTEKGKSYKKTHIIGATPVPPWAQKLIDAGGNVKRKDPWHLFRSDMLYAAAARRATKRFCPDAFIDLGLALNDDDALHPADYGGPDVHAEVGAVGGDDETGGQDQPDDDIEDAELVEDAPAASPATEPEEHLAGPAFVRGFATAVREATGYERRLDDADRHALVGYATAGRTSSTREVWRNEAKACFDVLGQLLDGKLHLADVDAGGRRVVAT